MTEKFGLPEEGEKPANANQADEDPSKSALMSKEMTPPAELEDLLARPPRVEELIKELREKTEQGKFNKTRQGNFGKTEIVPDWQKINSFLEEQGFPQKRDKRGRSTGKYLAIDGTTVDEGTLRFWIGLNEWDKVRLEKASEYKNSLGFFRNVLATEEGLDVAGMPKTELIEEIFRIMGTTKQKRGDEFVYVFSDGELPWKEMAEFFHFRSQSAMVKRFNERREQERQETDRWRQEAENWWKKYD